MNYYLDGKINAIISRKRIRDAKYQIRKYNDVARYFRDMAAVKQLALKTASIAKKAARSAKNSKEAKELSIISKIAESVSAGKTRVVKLAKRIKNALADVLMYISRPFRAFFDWVADKLFQASARYRLWNARINAKEIGKGYDNLRKKLTRGIHETVKKYA